MAVAYVLGIETSCDETGVAIFHHSFGVCSNELFSQISLHQQFGGVLPEVASREQLEKIDIIITRALTKAGITLADIDAIAVTNKPGLAGSLLVGVCFAKAVAWTTSKPLIAVDHLEGHTFSSMIEHAVPFPHLCLTASGGHTSLHLVHDFGQYDVLSKTGDDAVGEALDKIARLMGLPYPGGPVLEQLAAEVDFIDFYRYPRGKTTTLNFSFSGLKTAVLYDLVNRGAYNLTTKEFLQPHNHRLQKEVASSLMVCVADIFEQKIRIAIRENHCIKAITFVGGVACNKYLKKRLSTYANSINKPFFSPSPQYCTDNGAMIAFVGNYKAQKGEFAPLSLDIYT
jgi:N6-L-threonylcarbamoyladenine synthase